MRDFKYGAVLLLLGVLSACGGLRPAGWREVEAPDGSRFAVPPRWSTFTAEDVRRQIARGEEGFDPSLRLFLMSYLDRMVFAAKDRDRFILAARYEAVLNPDLFESREAFRESVAQPLREALEATAAVARGQGWDLQVRKMDWHDREGGLGDLEISLRFRAEGKASDLVLRSVFFEDAYYVLVSNASSELWEEFLTRTRFAAKAARKPISAARSTPTSQPTPKVNEGRFAVGFRSEPVGGLVLSVEVFERKGSTLTVYASFVRQGDTAATSTPQTKDFRLEVRGQFILPDETGFPGKWICPIPPDPKSGRCIWGAGAVARGWWRYTIPEDAQPPFDFDAGPFGKVPLQPGKPAPEAGPPQGPFPEGEWTFEAAAFPHPQAPGFRLMIQAIRVRGDRLEIQAEMRRAQGLFLIMGQLPGADALVLVDAEGHQAAPDREASEALERAWKRLDAFEGDATRFSMRLVYPRPKASGPLILSIPDWFTARFDPKTGRLEEVRWTSSGWAPAPTPTPSPAQIARTEAEALRKELSEAWANQDAETFLSAFVDLDDEDAQRLRVTVAGGGWPLTDRRVEFEGGQWKRERAREVRVRFSATLSGFPAEARWEGIGEADLEKRDGRWRIVRWKWIRAPIWARFPGTASASEHFTLIAPSEVPDGTRRAVLEELEEAYADLARALPSEVIPPRVLILYAQDARSFEDVTGRSPQRTLGTAFASYEGVYDEDERLVDARPTEMFMVLNAEGVRGFRSDDPLHGRKAVLRHELVHVFLTPWTRPWTPGWLVEGAALTFAGQPFERALKPVEALGTFTYTVKFGHIGDIFGTAETQQYALAAALAAFVRERWGDEAFLSLYRAAAKAQPEELEEGAPLLGLSVFQEAWIEGIAQRVMTRAIPEVLEVSPSAFEQEFLEWWRRRR